MNARLLTRQVHLLAVVLISFGVASCFRGYDTSKVKCKTDKDCPNQYPTCFVPSNQTVGTCSKGGVDGGRADQRVESDGKAGADVPAKDGSRDMGGASGGRSDTGSGGTSGAAGTTGSGGSDNIDAPIGGTGGVIMGGEPGGGETSSGGVTSTGGTEQGGSSTTTGSTGTPTDAPLAKGSACNSNGECANGLCIDGFCCDKECSGCNACASAMTGVADGTCAPVAAGNDPHKTCTDETATKPCGNDGTCDGKGACRKVGKGQECGAASCGDGTTFTPKPLCDGNGTCVAGSPEVCTPYECAAATGCKRTCTKQEECNASTSYCDMTAKVCVPKKANGKPATQTYECESKIVADGVCCDKECTGCNACTSALNGQLASTTGTCMEVTAAKAADPHGVCPAGSDPCGMDGTCSGTGTCHYAAAGSDCGTPSCDADTSMLTKKTCSATHVCTAGAASACPGLRACASTSSCKAGACTVDGDCAANNFCLSGTCTPKYADGHSCTAGANNQCLKNNCVGGTCCSTPCGECHTCSNATGTCTQVNNGTACGTGVCNGGVCTACNANQLCTLSGSAEECYNHVTSCQTGSSVCVRSTAVNNGTPCGSAATCSGTQSIGHWTCQGGTCTKPTPTSCAYTCNPSTGACAGECSPTSKKCYSTTQIQTCTSSYTWDTPTGCGAGKTCSGNQCVCSAGTCGSNCITCGSSTPYCVSGECGQCRDIADCPANYYACNSSNHQCVCKPQDGNNKVVNGGLDGSASGWILDGATYVANTDADRCPGSGVLKIPSTASIYSTPFQQCFSAGAGVSYRFGFRFQGNPNCTVAFYSVSGCNSSYMISMAGFSPNYETPIPMWTNSTPVEKSTPDGTVSVSVSCTVDPYYPADTIYDQIYFNTGGGAF